MESADESGTEKGPGDENHSANGEFYRRVLFVVGLGIGLWVAFLLRDIILLAFAGLLIAMVLRAAGMLVERVTKLGEKTSLVIGGLLVLALLVGTVWLVWPIFAEQLPNLVDRLDEAITELEDSLGIDLPSSVSDLTETLGSSSGQIVSSVMSALGLVISVVSGIVLVIFVGIFLAAEPHVYRNGLILLFPIRMHGQVRRAVRKVGGHLFQWLRAQGIIMITVGVVTGLGAWAIGLPSPIALGVFAGVGEFIPLVGPFIAAVPAVVVAFSEGWTMVLWTMILYIGIQQLEGNILTPIVQRDMLSIPPVLLLLALLGFGLLFGPMGIVLGAPLTVAGFIFVREFYVRDYLDQDKLLDH